jgi:hypothetical protein
MATERFIHHVRCTTALFAACVGLTACASASPTGDTDLAPWLAEGTSLEMRVFGDADGDGDVDVLLVVDRAPGRASSPRALLILRRDPDGSLAEALDSPKAILCRACGGMMGDPLQGVSVESGKLTLRFEGGSRELWSSEYRFAYVPARGQWRLMQIAHQGLDRITQASAERRQTIFPAENVPLDLFDPADYPADAIP